jgi:FAD/FMN-containing dehydrogenase
LYDL